MDSQYLEELLHEADMMELPHIIQKCCEYHDVFMLNNERALELLKHNIINQRTLIQGDLKNMQGFINYGIRPLNNNKPKTLYIRVVFVNPKSQGKGLAKKMISSSIKKASEDNMNFTDGVWMQICSTNHPMKKVASKLNFQNIDIWDYNGSKAEIWYKENL